MKIYGYGGGLLLKSFAAAIGAKDEKRNWLLNPAGAAEISVVRSAGRRPWSIHLFTLRICVRIRFSFLFGIDESKRSGDMSEAFPDWLLFQPGAKYEPHEQDCQNSSNGDPKKEQHSGGMGHLWKPPAGLGVWSKRMAPSLRELCSIRSLASRNLCRTLQNGRVTQE